MLNGPGVVPVTVVDGASVRLLSWPWSTDAFVLYGIAAVVWLLSDSVKLPACAFWMVMFCSQCVAVGKSPAASMSTFTRAAPGQ